MVTSQRIPITVARIGTLDQAEADNIVAIAEQSQDIFEFTEVRNLGIDLNPYAMPNGGFDLDSVVEKEVLPMNLKQPVFLLTSEPYGVLEKAEEPDWFYFSGTIDPHHSIISTYLWDNMEGERRLQPYLLFMLGTTLISEYSGLQFHDETAGCLFDYCDEPEDIERSLKSDRFLCGRCTNILDRQIKAGKISIDQVIASLRLIHRARSNGLSCFISYNHRDEEFARLLHEQMKKIGLNVWLAVNDLGEGKIHEQIERTIKLHDKVLLILSENSMSSNWVKSEIRWAIEADIIEGTRRILPIRLTGMDDIKQWKYFDADYGKDLAKEIREYHIYDFSGWRDIKSFMESFDRLVAVLS